ATAAPSLAPAVDPAALPGLDSKVDSFLTSLMEAAPRSPEFAQKAGDVRSMGDVDIRHAAESSNRLLQSPVKALTSGGLSEGSTVGKTLLELRRTVENLDPKEATGAKKLLGMIPFGDKIEDYFRKYQSAQSHLEGILHSLRDGQDELGKDNAALNMEKQQLWDAMGRLNQYVYVAERLDARLSATIAELEATDPEKARALREDVLFYVRQKHQDLLVQLAVSIQNYLAIDIVIKNNIELIKGVDRASTTTVSALRTAVIVAQALGNQKLVLDQITALNTTTSGMIERTSQMLRDNSVAIQQQAASATIGLPQLQAAFANIYATMDAIDTFKVQALDNMAATIGTLENEVTKSRSYLDRVAQQDQRVVAGTLDLGR
ncbi:toxic anion resistance protein, partial [Kribbella sp. NPDC006257]|uniref:toxic anion resistance protein n=1 Tax=Kribbella sp. NPDC006257 TaxID=3156738 RepID=UPI0033BB983F